MKKPTVVERYWDWAAKPGAPKWHEPILVIGNSVLLTLLFVMPLLCILCRGEL